MYLHGIEHINLPSDAILVNDVVTAVIALIGTAEKGPTNELTLCTSEKDDAQFGKTGTIPESLKAIRLQRSARGNAVVLVVRVEAESVIGQTIIGEVQEDGTRTGLKLFETSLSKFGFVPMIYIAPHYSALAAVRTELAATIARYEAMAYVDMMDGYTVSAAIQARGTSGEFSNASPGHKLLFPQFSVANPASDPENPGEEAKYLTLPMSAYCAGLRAKIDLEEGWHVSSSNHQIIGIDGISIPLTFDIGDASCEVNMLNAAGITTAVNMYGSGIVEWGNYTAAFPGTNDPEAFECVRRVRAIIKRALDTACVRYIDKLQIKQAHIDLVRDSVNSYYNTLINKGIIVEGKCIYDKAKNPVSELAQGHVTFTNEFTPAVPMQRMTFEHQINIANLANIS